jgi:hypothetical protein
MRCLRTTETNYANAVSYGFLLSTCICGLSSSPLLATELRQKAVVELFTSQGCASCPPADALLGQLAKRDDIVALTMPVNYWDHLGWKDTLAKDVYTERQRGYAASRGDREIYTPQLVVNGVAHVVGSSPDAIEDALHRTDNALEKVRVPISLTSHKGTVQLHAGAVPEGSNFRSGTVWVACFSHSVAVDIRRGENNGHRITYTNVVRSLTPAARWTGHEISVEIAIPHEGDIDGCATFLQADDSKAILGAAITRQATD